MARTARTARTSKTVRTTRSGETVTITVSPGRYTLSPGEAYRSADRTPLGERIPKAQQAQLSRLRQRLADLAERA